MIADGRHLPPETTSSPQTPPRWARGWQAPWFQVSPLPEAKPAPESHPFPPSSGRQNMPPDAFPRFIPCFVISRWHWWPFSLLVPGIPLGPAFLGHIHPARSWEQLPFTSSAPWCSPRLGLSSALRPPPPCSTGFDRHAAGLGSWRATNSPDGRKITRRHGSDRPFCPCPPGVAARPTVPAPGLSRPVRQRPVKDRPAISSGDSPGADFRDRGVPVRCSWFAETSREV